MLDNSVHMGMMLQVLSPGVQDNEQACPPAWHTREEAGWCEDPPRLPTYGSRSYVWYRPQEEEMGLGRYIQLYRSPLGALQSESRTASCLNSNVYRARVALITVFPFADCRLRDTFGGARSVPVQTQVRHQALQLRVLIAQLPQFVSCCNPRPAYFFFYR